MQTLWLGRPCWYFSLSFPRMTLFLQQSCLQLFQKFLSLHIVPTRWDPVLKKSIKGSFIHSFIHSYCKNIYFLLKIVALQQFTYILTFLYCKWRRTTDHFSRPLCIKIIQFPYFKYFGHKFILCYMHFYNGKYWSISKLRKDVCRWFRFAQLAKGKKSRP